MERRKAREDGPSCRSLRSKKSIDPACAPVGPSGDSALVWCQSLLFSAERNVYEGTPGLERTRCTRARIVTLMTIVWLSHGCHHHFRASFFSPPLKVLSSSAPPCSHVRSSVPTCVGGFSLVLACSTSKTRASRHVTQHSTPRSASLVSVFSPQGRTLSLSLQPVKQA